MRDQNAVRSPDQGGGWAGGAGRVHCDQFRWQNDHVRESVPGAGGGARRGSQSGSAARRVARAGRTRDEQDKQPYQDRSDAVGPQHEPRCQRILEKMTSLPRSLVRPAMEHRSVLEEGAVADLTVFDPAAIRGNATLENPNQFSSGIELVVVNGKPAYRNGQLEAQTECPSGAESLRPNRMGAARGRPASG